MFPSCRQFVRNDIQWSGQLIFLSFLFSLNTVAQEKNPVLTIIHTNWLTAQYMTYKAELYLLSTFKLLFIYLLFFFFCSLCTIIKDQLLVPRPIPKPDEVINPKDELDRAIPKTKNNIHASLYIHQCYEILIKKPMPQLQVRTHAQRHGYFPPVYLRAVAQHNPQAGCLQSQWSK